MTSVADGTRTKPKRIVSWSWQHAAAIVIAALIGFAYGECNNLHRHITGTEVFVDTTSEHVVGVLGQPDVMYISAENNLVIVYKNRQFYLRKEHGEWRVYQDSKR
jgi:hypothetical protein